MCASAGGTLRPPMTRQLCARHGVYPVDKRVAQHANVSSATVAANKCSGRYQRRREGAVQILRIVFFASVAHAILGAHERERRGLIG